MSIGNEWAKPHIYPLFGLVALITQVALQMLVRRLAAAKNRQIKFGYFKLMQREGQPTIPEKMVATERNFINLFEVPVLFFSVIPLLILFDKTTQTTLFISWLFVISRALHTLIHVTHNWVKPRAATYFVGYGLMLALWIALVL